MIALGDTPGRQDRPAPERTRDAAPVDVGRGMGLGDVGEGVFDVLCDD